jgi:hypothetical protein
MSLLLKQDQIENETYKKVLTKTFNQEFNENVNVRNEQSLFVCQNQFQSLEILNFCSCNCFPIILENRCCRSSGLFVEMMNVLGLPLKSNQRSLKLFTDYVCLVGPLTSYLVFQKLGDCFAWVYSLFCYKALFEMLVNFENTIHSR